jgi:PEP-CTERM motif
MLREGVAMKRLPWVACATVVLLGCSAAQATVYTLASPGSQSRISMGWTSSDGLYGTNGMVVGNTVAVTGALDISVVNGPLGTPVRLSYESSAVSFYFEDQTVQATVFNTGQTPVGVLDVTLGFWMDLYDTVDLEGPLGMPVAPPVEIDAISTPTLTFGFTPLGGDREKLGSVFLWRLNSEYQERVLLRSNLLAGDDITQTLGVEMQVQYGQLPIGGVARPGTFNLVLDTTLTTVPVPEPATWALWLGGLAALGGIARRRRTAA